YQPRRSTPEEPFLSRQAARHANRFLVGAGHEVVDDRHVQRPRNLVLPDPFDLVRNPFRLALPLASPHLGQDRSDRIAGDDLNLWITLFEIAADAGDRAARPGGADEV